MAESLSAIQRVPEFLREPVGEYVSLVRELAGETARSVTLFGAVVAGAFDPERHTVTNVVVLDEVRIDLLRRLAEHGARLGKHRIAAPLIMTPAYIQQSLDTFPLELLEIHQQHVTVIGTDFFVDLAFDDAHMRLQCERELKVAAIGLRQGLLATVGSERLLADVLVDAAGGLLRTLRGMLWLRGHKQAQPAPAVLEAIEQVTDRTLPGLRAALDPSDEHGWGTFEKLYDDVDALGAIVDAW
jgi:hypothetical protein